MTPWVAAKTRMNTRSSVAKAVAKLWLKGRLGVPQRTKPGVLSLSRCLTISQFVAKRETAWIGRLRRLAALAAPLDLANQTR
jgi:hypothetical protein